jgi:hypothetical protein
MSRILPTLLCRWMLLVLNDDGWKGLRCPTQASERYPAHTNLLAPEDWPFSVADSTQVARINGDVIQLRLADAAWTQYAIRIGRRSLTTWDW